MTQENKELLLRDLCARLPYGVKIELAWWEMGEGTCINTTLEPDHIEQLLNDEDGDTEIKPYLRPMSSMTEEEWEELSYIGHIVPLYDGSFGVDMRAYCKNSQPHYRRFSEFSTIEDWLNAHHLDHRGLIEKGLANKASEEMYSLNK